MKIGIVTVPDSANFGSYLQAYALASVFAEWGNEVVFVKTRNTEYLKKLYVNWCPGKWDLKHPVQYFRKNFNGLIKRKKFINAQTCFQMTDIHDAGEFDLIFLGSDEIWNVCTKVFQNPLFYGHGMERVIAFAVSAGKAQYQDFLKYPDIIEDIKQIEEIYVRDEKTRKIVEQITHKSPGMVCDPTFLVPLDSLKREYNGRDLDRCRYLAVYFYPNSLSKDDVNKIKVYAKKQGLKTVSVGFWNGWCDYNIVCSPLEFPTVLEKAESVITGTFHGTIFSVLCQKSFVSIALSDKVTDLLEQIGLSERCIARNEFTMDMLKKKLLTESIDYDRTEKTIQKMKIESLHVLKGVINRYARLHL